jgi:hypothetical protein
MTETNPPDATSSVRPFIFESYGVRVQIDGNRQDLIDEAEIVARRSLLDNLRIFDGPNVDQHFELNRTGRSYYLIQNDKEIASGGSRRKFLKFFDSMVRVAVAERAVDSVFLHAGVVGWKGKAIVLPADSFKGKSTLVAEFVRHGAAYFSDDFAVFDKNGLVHAYPRQLAMRTEGGKYREYKLTVEALGGVHASGPIPVGLVLFTEYQPGAKWDPQLITSGNGVLEMIPYALTFRHDPKLSLRVLNYVASRAIIASSPRGTAKDFVEVILNFVDNNVI